MEEERALANALQGRAEEKQQLRMAPHPGQPCGARPHKRTRSAKRHPSAPSTCLVVMRSRVTCFLLSTHLLFWDCMVTIYYFHN